MRANEVLRQDQLTLAFSILQDPSFREVREDLSVALKLPLKSLDEVFQLAPTKFVKVRRRIINAVRHHLTAFLVKLHNEICTEFDYCRKRNLPIAILVEHLAKILEQSIPTASTEAGALTALLCLLDSICGCRVAV